MSPNLHSHILDTSWQDHVIWSEVANRLKLKFTLSRTTALLLGIAGAILETLAAQLAPAHLEVARVLSLVGAVVLAAVPLFARGFGKTHVQNWIRARSVSESLKEEVFFYLTQTGLYADEVRITTLARRTKEIVDKVEDLAVLAVTLKLPVSSPPVINGPDDYLQCRVTQQIETYYLPKAKSLSQRLQWCQWLAAGLTGIAALVGGIVGFFQPKLLGAWIAVATTIAGAITAHAAAARYEELVMSYYSTAKQLQLLRDQFLDSLRGATPDAATFAEFVRRCEEVISIETQAWMADWQKLQESKPASPPS